MAVYAANQTGTWSTLATWVSTSAMPPNALGNTSSWGVATALPGANDIVLFNGKTVTYDTTINVNRISSVVSGSDYGSPLTNVLSGGVITPSATVTITASNGIYLGHVGSSPQAWFMTLTSANVVNITASVIDQSASQQYGIYLSSTGATLNVTASSIIGNSSVTSTNTGAILLGNFAATLRVQSNITGSNSPAIQTTGTTAANGTYIINGNVTTIGQSPGIFSTSPITITVNGNVTAGSISPGIASTTAAGLITVNGSIVNVNGFQGVQSQRLILSSSSATAMSWTWQDPAGNNITYSPSTANITYPDPAAVRSGSTGTTSTGTGDGTLVVPADTDVKESVQYDNGTKTGKMRVPSYLDVRATVAVDSGSGAIIMPTEAQVQSGVTFDSGSSKTGTYDGVAAFWGYSTASMTAGSIGGLITQSLDVRIGTITGSLISELDNTGSSSNTIRRMQNAATVHTTGDQLSSYNT